MSEVFYLKKGDVKSFDGKKTTNHTHRVSDVDRKKEFELWSKLKPIYFQTWVWEEVCKRFPDRYKMFLPTYQGQKVILT